ncbi:malate synthase A [Brevibacterium litoralis]|uniref:malate synthase A n=1 Tax=Brevibacterium litoralis TaxID=3138935 RepID=UPI0032EB7F4C
MSRMKITGSLQPGFEDVLTPAALDFLAALHEEFHLRRLEVLSARQMRTEGILRGTFPTFKEETRAIREDTDWQVAGHVGAPGLEDRRVEIAGPVSARMAITALNSDAKVWLADLEDATSPTWENIVSGQDNLRRAVRGELEHTVLDDDGEVVRHYSMKKATPPTIVVRPRSWHLPERHLVWIDEHGAEHVASGSLVDFGLYFFHNARELVERGRGPYFYLAKLEASREAKLWNDVFTFAQERIGMAHGTIRATVLIETITAAFQMEEILWELRDHAAGLNAGRWDYIFSVIKNFRTHADFVLPDRSEVTMTVPFMRAYTELLVRTCHKRGAHAIGGMNAFVPDRNDPEVAERAFAEVRSDKERDVADGFDGSWVAHPDLIATAQEPFDAVLGDRPHQLDVLREDVDATVKAADLIDMTGIGGREARVTEEGLRTNIRVGLNYLNSWLSGVGAVALDDLMEDAATAEISRAQIWQWIHHGVQLSDGRTITRPIVERCMAEELAQIERHPADHYCDAMEVFRETTLGDDLPPFFTTTAYAKFMVERYTRRLDHLLAA